MAKIQKKTSKGMSNVERYRSKMKKIESGRQQFWKPEEGNNLIRILPPLKDSDDFFLETRAHFIPGAGEQGRSSRLVCSDDGKCLVCKALQTLQQSEDDDDQKLAQECQATATYWLQIVNLEDPDKGTQIWRHYANTVIYSLLEFFVDPEWGDFTHEKKGRNVKLRQNKSGNQIRYEVSLKPKTSSIDSDFLDQRKDLRPMAGTYDKAEAKRLHNFLTGGRFEADEDADDYDEAKKEVKKKKSKKSSNLRSKRDLRNKGK